MKVKEKGSNSLGYSSAAHGDWGIVRVGMLVPECYQLFICPFACGRHGALGAIHHENKDRLSYLYLEESDIVSGSYEDEIVEAVYDLVNKYHKKFRAMLLMVSCIDDLMVTDHDAIIAKLKANHPHIDFHFGHMNPISADGSLPPAINIQKSIYSFLKPMTKDKSILISATNIPIDKSSELYELASINGYKIRHISETSNYDDYLTLSKASLNLVLNPLGNASALDLNERLKMEYYNFMTSYDINTIKKQYDELKGILNLKYDINISAYIDQLNAKIIEVKNIIGKREIALDDSASIVCFGLAKFLVNCGFNLKYILIDAIRKFDYDNYQWIKDNTDIKIASYTDSIAIKERQNKPDTLCIGLEAAYFFNSNHSLSIMFDGGLFGIKGMILLLDMIKDIALAKTNVKEVIQEAGLVV